MGPLSGLGARCQSFADARAARDVCRSVGDTCEHWSSPGFSQHRLESDVIGADEKNASPHLLPYPTSKSSVTGGKHWQGGGIMARHCP